MRKFVIKNVKHNNFSKIRPNSDKITTENKVVTEKVQENVTENKVEVKKEEVMDTKEKIELANAILGDEQKVKRVKKEKGLIERAESSLTILTEDNRELLKD